MHVEPRIVGYFQLFRKKGRRKKERYTPNVQKPGGSVANLKTAKVIKRIKSAISYYKRFARKNEDTLLAICVLYIKNRRKRPFHLGIIYQSVLLLNLLYGSKKATVEKLMVSVGTISTWLLAVGIGDIEEIKKLCSENGGPAGIISV